MKHLLTSNVGTYARLLSALPIVAGVVYAMVKLADLVPHA